MTEWLEIKGFEPPEAYGSWDDGPVVRLKNAEHEGVGRHACSDVLMGEEELPLHEWVDERGEPLGWEPTHWAPLQP